MSLEEQNYNLHFIQLNNEYEIKKELTTINADKKIYNLLIPKMTFLHLKLEQVDLGKMLFKGLLAGSISLNGHSPDVLKSGVQKYDLQRSSPSALRSFNRR